jgi:hypothetical protein
LALSGKGHCARGIDLNALVSNRSSQALPQSENSLRVVAADSPEFRRVDTLVILLSGAEPKWGRTCFCIVVSSRAQVVGRRSSRGGSHTCAHSARLSSPRRGISPRCGNESDFDLSLPALSVNQSGLGLAVVLPGGIAVTHLVAHDGTGSSGGIALLNATPLNVRHPLSLEPVGSARVIKPSFDRRPAVPNVATDSVACRTLTTVAPPVQGVDRHAQHLRQVGDRHQSFKLVVIPFLRFC